LQAHIIHLIFFVTNNNNELVAKRCCLRKPSSGVVGGSRSRLWRGSTPLHSTSLGILVAGNRPFQGSSVKLDAARVLRHIHPRLHSSYFLSGDHVEITLLNVAPAPDSTQQARHSSWHDEGDYPSFRRLGWSSEPTRLRNDYTLAGQLWLHRSGTDGWVQDNKREIA